MVCHIDCSQISQARQLHETLARLLNFPQWYGHNLDALYDCITELPSPTGLYLSNWDHNFPWAAGFEAVLADAQECCPEFNVVFELNNKGRNIHE